MVVNMHGKVVSFPDPTFLEIFERFLVFADSAVLDPDAPIRIVACDFSCDMKAS